MITETEGRKTISDSVAMKDEAKKGKSILERYNKSYRYTVLIGVAVMIGAFFIAVFISRSYKAVTQNMVSISNLEKSFTTVNGNVNMAYLFLSESGVGGYSSSREELTQNLDTVEAIAGKNYSRELSDLTNTIRTYLEQADKLIASVSAYINIPGSESDSYTGMSDEYDGLQETYSYAMLRFQESYSGLLADLNVREKEIQKRLVTTFLSFAVIFIIALLLANRYMARVYHDLSISMHTLLAGIRGMQEDLTHAAPIELDSQDEFGTLADAFNKMQVMLQAQQRKSAEMADVKARLAASENENLRIYGALQKNHLDFLQSRINPHFLFNTLNMIYAQAQAENAPKSAELMETTAAFLRYNLDNISKTVTLSQEIDNLKDYIEIQRYRYEDRIEYEFELGEDCMSHSMPCMVLQPLVENSIQHGLGMKMSGGKVKIVAKRSEERITFGTKDNGVGMSEEQIRALYQNLEENTSDSRHIGLRNIFMRLKLFYHDDVKLVMESSEPGVTILFTVPYTPVEGSGSTARSGVNSAEDGNE